MMNRRNFFSKCAAFVAGCALGVKAFRETAKPVINPEWEKAEYEAAFCYTKVSRTCFAREDDGTIGHYFWNDSTRKWIKIESLNDA